MKLEVRVGARYVAHLNLGVRPSINRTSPKFFTYGRDVNQSVGYQDNCKAL